MEKLRNLDLINIMFPTDLNVLEASTFLAVIKLSDTEIGSKEQKPEYALFEFI